MKLSCCIGTNKDRLDVMKKIGFKYCEVALSSLANLSDEDFAALKAKLIETGITPVSANGMFPGEINLLLGKEGYKAVEEYLDKAFPRAKELGVPVIILGSGNSRRIPEGMTLEEAEDLFCAVCRDVISPKCTEYGLIIGIEELNKNEVNFINSCKDAMKLIRRMNLPNIKLLVDFYHSIQEGDTVEELREFGKEGYIVHCHYGSPINERRAPKKGVDEHLVKEYMEMLKSVGYEGAFSIEGKITDFEAELTEAYEIMSAYN